MDVESRNTGPVRWHTPVLVISLLPRSFSLAVAQRFLCAYHRRVMPLPFNLALSFFGKTLAHMYIPALTGVTSIYIYMIYSDFALKTIPKVGK